MDPFSLAVGIVGLVDGGLNLSRELKGKIVAFRGAEQEVMELAHEIDLSVTLVDLLGQRFDRPEDGYPRNVVRQTRLLVEDMNQIFDRVFGLLQDFDASVKAAAKYVLDANELKEQHAKLKGLQLSFVFMLSVCPPSRPTMTATTGGSQAVSSQSTPVQIPITTTTASGETVTYMATLTLQPTEPNQVPTPPSNSAKESQTDDHPDFTEQLNRLRKDQRLKKKLANLASNPFFAKDSFGALFGAHARRASSTKSNGMVEYSYMEPISMKTGAPEDDPPTYASVPFDTCGEVDQEDHEEDFAARLAEESIQDAEDILDYLYDDSKATEKDNTSSDTGNEVEVIDVSNDLTNTSIRDYAHLDPEFSPERHTSTSEASPEEPPPPTPSGINEYEDPLRDGARLLRAQENDSNSPEYTTATATAISFSRPMAKTNLPPHPSVRGANNVQQQIHLVSTPAPTAGSKPPSAAASRTVSEPASRTNSPLRRPRQHSPSKRRECDGCDCKIPSAMQRYRCSECFDFVFCAPCYQGAKGQEGVSAIWHPHVLGGFEEVVLPNGEGARGA
ncbi:hypothetical protein LTR62_000096 [Meristemomyces frigidus]|uniref:ZZ-type domain-containing protein n=1 Tax=Meristemomyces frigidus TaxID=1508187 RepID=A0AAN7YUM2_9PEZI|nr:hypothetical protein LTR62_000096 [Meristemomyces frigidus]